jgi:dolichol-phosphate mannosyltransferase
VVQLIRSKKLISICIPVLNEIGNILALYKRLNKIADELKEKYDFEFIFTDNHSDDGTWDILIEFSNLDSRIKALRFSKNIGFQESIITNLKIASGEAMIQIDADLQDPPELLKIFLEEWENGFKVVYGVRKSRIENIFKRNFRKLGYRIISIVSAHEIPLNVGDFRLIDQSVKEVLIKSKVPYPYIRGMIASFGFKSTGVVYSREERTADKSKFPLRNVIRLGMNGVINHSTWLLKAPTLFGVCVLFSSVIITIYKVVLGLFSIKSLVVIDDIYLFLIFVLGLNTFFLGIIGTYLNRIFLILRDEPKYIIEESVNLENNL